MVRNVGNNTAWMGAMMLILSLIHGNLFAQKQEIAVTETDNTIFKQDGHWRGADGAATVKLASGKILWLFSDTFIDRKGTGKRSNSTRMIRNSIAIQDSSFIHAGLTYYYGGTPQKPDDFFTVPGKNWFWTGHGIMLEDRLLIFLIEETSTNSGIGFEAVGWYLAIIDNPSDNPGNWIIHYHKGLNTYGVIIGSSAVLEDENYIYTFGVKEPASHETYLVRFDKSELRDGNLTGLEWWVNNSWTGEVSEEPVSSSLFIGQTEFSVHYEPYLEKYVQIQTYGLGRASIGYRLADQLHGPWSEPVLIFTPVLNEDTEFVYTANAHPEYHSEKLIVTYNINNGDFSRLINNEDIYFPRILQIDWDRKR